MYSNKLENRKLMDEFENSNDVKRLFFGFEIQATWMNSFPEGRILREENRHVTLAFLGNQSFSQMQKDLKNFPSHYFRLGFAGWCDHLLFLPERKPLVVAGHVNWLDSQAFLSVHEALSSWLIAHRYKVDSREILPHVTLARAPFNEKKWKEAFFPFPLIAKSFNLYESTGNLNYHSLWNLPLTPLIEEVGHAAKTAFYIRGKDVKQIFLHAQLALAFKFPSMLHYFSDGSEVQSSDDLITQLNKRISCADAQVGCPFKKVSSDGEIIQEEGGVLLWKVIIDI